MLCAKKVGAKSCSDSFCLLKCRHKGTEFSVWSNEAPHRSQRGNTACLLKCSSTAWYPKADGSYPGWGPVCSQGFLEKAIYSLLKRATRVPVGISLLQTNVCYGSLFIMNKEGIIGQCNNFGRGEPAAERQSSSLPYHAHTERHPSSLMLSWIAHAISWSRVCISEEVNWQLSLHSTFPWSMAVTYSVAFVYQAKQPGLLGLESNRESRGSHGRLVHHTQQPAKWSGKKHSKARKGLLSLKLLVQMDAQALFPFLLQARCFVNLLCFSQIRSIWLLLMTAYWCCSP